jgi:hypothetical protein
MTPEVAKLTLQFLERVTLQATEIPALQACVEELRKELYQEETTNVPAEP